MSAESDSTGSAAIYLVYGRRANDDEPLVAVVPTVGDAEKLQEDFRGPAHFVDVGYETHVLVGAVGPAKPGSTVHIVSYDGYDDTGVELYGSQDPVGLGVFIDRDTAEQFAADPANTGAGDARIRAVVVGQVLAES